MPQWRLNIPHGAVKTWHSQINYRNEWTNKLVTIKKKKKKSKIWAASPLNPKGNASSYWQAVIWVKSKLNCWRMCSCISSAAIYLVPNMCWDFCLALIIGGEQRWWTLPQFPRSWPQGRAEYGCKGKGCGSQRTAVVPTFVGDLTCLQSQEKLPREEGWPEFWSNGYWRGRRGEERTSLLMAEGDLGWTSGQGGVWGIGGHRLWITHYLSTSCLFGVSSLLLWASWVVLVIKNPQEK